MRIRIFGFLFIITLLATVALFVGETPRGIVRAVGSHGLPWLAIVLALGIPLIMGIFWAMKPKHNPWNRKSLQPATKPSLGGNEPLKPGGTGR